MVRPLPSRQGWNRASQSHTKPSPETCFSFPKTKGPTHVLPGRKVRTLFPPTATRTSHILECSCSKGPSLLSRWTARDSASSRRRVEARAFPGPGCLLRACRSHPNTVHSVNKYLLSACYMPDYSGQRGQSRKKQKKTRKSPLLRAQLLEGGRRGHS